MIRLSNKDTGAVIGEISEDDLDFLVDNLIEESGDDTDYYIDRDTLDLLKNNGGSESLMSVIEKAMGDKDDIEIQWERA